MDLKENLFVAYVFQVMPMSCLGAPSMYVQDWQAEYTCS